MILVCMIAKTVHYTVHWRKKFPGENVFPATVIWLTLSSNPFWRYVSVHLSFQKIFVQHMMGKWENISLKRRNSLPDWSLVSVSPFYTEVLHSIPRTFGTMVWHPRIWGFYTTVLPSIEQVAPTISNFLMQVHSKMLY